MIGQVLGRRPNNDIGEELIIGVYNDVSANGYVIMENASGSNAHLWSYDAERADESVVGNLCGWINTSKRAYF